MKSEVILVDLQDYPIGTCEKLMAHLEGKLHRAISVFIFNSKGEMLMQQRAFEKYHSGGLWTNTCCSHPCPGEEALDAAQRRLFEEMGIQCKLKKVFEFVYQTDLDNGLIEYEYDHVFIGFFDKDPILNREEACNFRWEDPKMILEKMKKKPDCFTFWFKKILTERFEFWLSPSI